ncbi:MAG: oligosaccharide flippase family protein [Burkholderiales bacterium]
MRRLAVPLAGNLLMMLLGLASTKLMAGQYAPQDFGLVAYVNGLTVLFAILADLGLGLAHIKKLGDGADPKDCVRVYLTVKIGLMLLVAVPMSLFIGVFVPLQSNLPRSDVWLVSGVMIAAWFFSFLSHWIGYTFAGLQDMKRQFTIEVARSASLLLFLALTAATAGQALQLALGYLAASLVSLAVALVLIWPYLGGRFDRALLSEYRALAVPIGAGLLLVNVARNCDGLLLTAATSLHEAGLYYAAKRITSPLEVTGGYIGHMALPYIASLDAANRETIAPYVGRLEQVLTVLFGPVMAFALFFAGPVSLALLGPQYAGAAPALGLLGAAFAVATITVPYSSVPTGIGVPKVAAWIAGLSAGIWLVGSLVLVPARLGGVPLLGWGAAGMAAAFLGASVVRSALERRASARLVAARATRGTTATALISFLAAGGVAAAAHVAGWRIDSVASVAVAFAAVLALHAALLVATGLVSPQDLRRWAGLVTPDSARRGAPMPPAHGSSETEMPNPFSE